MEFIKNNDEQYEIVKYFQDIENSEFQNMNFDEKINVLKLALKKNLNSDNITESLIFISNIVVSLIRESIINESTKIREFGLYLTFACFVEAEYLFEPYLNALLPDLLDMFNDRHRDVINLNTLVMSKIFENLNPYLALDVLGLFKERINDQSWKISLGCLKLISILTDVAPKQIDFLLPELVPLITSQAASSKKEVKEQSTETLNKCCSRISNPDVIPLIPKLVLANKDPKEAPMAIDALMETTFVNQVERSTLAVIVPILNKGLKDRASKLRRKCCVVIDNMCKLVNDSRDVKPFESDLLPFVIRERDEASQPEVREMAGKAAATLSKALNM